MDNAKTQQHISLAPTDEDRNAEINARIFDVIDSTDGKIFTATFVKKNGEVRKMNCRTDVTAHLKGGDKGYDARSKNLETVYDMQSRGYRTINVNTTQEITFGGTRHVFRS